MDVARCVGWIPIKRTGRNMSDYELYIETDDGIVRLTEPPDKPPRITVGPKPEPTEPKSKKEKKEVSHDDTD